MITIVGILVGLLVYVLFSPVRIRKGEASQRLAEMYSLDTSRSLSEMDPHTLAYQLLASGVRLQPITFRLITLGGGLAMGVITWPLLPGIPALAVGLISILLPYAWLDGRVKGRGREIDRLLPVAIGRITAGLLAGGAVPEVLQKTGESLELEGPNPLTPELLLTAAELRSKERKQSLRGLASRSPSTSLGNLAYLLEGYSESGGGKYAEVLFQTSQRVQQILISRNRATAKAADALTSARIIPFVLLVVFIFLTRDPLINEALLALSVQMVIGICIGMMVLGVYPDPIDRSGGRMTIVTLIGIFTSLFLITVWIEFVPSLPAGKAARFLSESDEPAPPPMPGWRKLLSGLDHFTARFAPGSFLRQTRADLYFAQLGGKWTDWDAVQLTSLRLAVGLASFVLGLLVYDNLFPAILAGLLGWIAPGMLVSGTARRLRRRFQAQLPEYIQLVAAQIAAGVSLEEALRRTAQTESLVARWMRNVLQMSQGRVVFNQLQKEAQASYLPDLIGMAVQLDFVRQGTAQQELMSQMAGRIAAEFAAGADQRAERVGAELVIPMVVFYFLPFILIILTLIGWPILATL